MDIMPLSSLAGDAVFPDETPTKLHPADIAAIASDLHHPDSPQVRWYAADRLEVLGVDAGEAGHQALSDAVLNEETDGCTRMRATQALAAMRGASSDTGARALARTLLQDTSDVYLKCSAAGTLGHLGESAGKVGIAALGRAVQTDDHNYVRRQAAVSLGEIGPETGVRAAEIAAVPALAMALRQDHDATTRWRACEALVKLGPLAGDHGIAALAGVLREDIDIGARWRAADALGGLGDIAGDVGASALVNAHAYDRSEIVRDQALLALDKVREMSLSFLASSEHEYVRGRAVLALGEFGLLAPQAAVEALVRALFQDTATYVRRRACESLGKLGLACGEVGAAALTKASAEDVDIYIQCKAMEFVEGLGVVGEAGQTALAKVLKGELVEDSSLFTHIANSSDELYDDGGDGEVYDIHKDG